LDVHNCAANRRRAFDLIERQFGRVEGSFPHK
jgi:hypothetical protein